MAATVMFDGDWGNQFPLTYDELEETARRAQTFEKTRTGVLEVEYKVVTELGHEHALVVPTHDAESFERIRYGRHMHKVDQAFMSDHFHVVEVGGTS
jgi:hypothetical protein